MIRGFVTTPRIIEGNLRGKYFKRLGKMIQEDIKSYKSLKDGVKTSQKNMISSSSMLAIIAKAEHGCYVRPKILIKEEKGISQDTKTFITQKLKGLWYTTNVHELGIMDMTLGSWNLNNPELVTDLEGLIIDGVINNQALKLFCDKYDLNVHNITTMSTKKN